MPENSANRILRKSFWSVMVLRYVIGTRTGMMIQTGGECEWLGYDYHDGSPSPFIDVCSLSILCITVLSCPF